MNLELAKELATNQDNKYFDDFQDISNKNKITIGLGMPTKLNSDVQIQYDDFSARQAKTNLFKTTITLLTNFLTL